MQNISTSSSNVEQQKHSNDINAPVILRNICFSYDDQKTWTLKNLNLTISLGERVAIVGKNGSGKSTLAKIIAGLIAPDSGLVELCSIKVFDNTTAYSDSYISARKFIGALFQGPEDQIITTVTEDDVAFGLENLQIPQDQMHKRISESLKAVHMENQRYDDPSAMSGGQQQRVALAGSIAMNSKLLVLDEPTSMLDSSAKKEVDKLFDNLHKNNTTIVQITHRFEECKKADRVFLLENGVLQEVSSENLKTSFFDAGRKNKNLIKKVKQDTKQEDAAYASKSNKNFEYAIKISDLTVQYDKTQPAIFNNYSLNIKSGEIVAIMGNNGSGKSTLAKTMCGLLKATSGTVNIHGIPVTDKTSRAKRQELRKTIGYVMQLPEQQLFAQTVTEDVAYAPHNFGLHGTALKKRVDETLQTLKLEHLAENSPFELSGGQQRLVAIAGVLAYKPRVIVLDEPTAGLDSESSDRIHKILKTLNNQGTTIVLITHNLEEAELLGARIINICKTKKQTSEAEERSKAGKVTKVEKTQTSKLSTFDPRITLLSSIMLMLSAFTINNYTQLSILASAALILAITARIRLIKLLSSLHVLIAIFIFSGLLNILAVRTGRVLARIATIPITTDGINCAILFATRFSLVIIIGAIVVITMSQTMLTEACERLTSPLRKIGIPTQEIALIMSLALRFLPTLASEAQAVALAQIARGSSIRDGSLSKRVKAITALIIPGFAGVIRHADTLALALDTRCYVPGAERTHLHSWKVKAKDLALLTFAILTVVIIVTYSFLRVI